MSILEGQVTKIKFHVHTPMRDHYSDHVTQGPPKNTFKDGDSDSSLRNYYVLHFNL